MPFDIKRFEKVKFDDRTEAVSVPDLKEWFGEGEAPEIIVRGLTGPEIARANEAAAKNKNMAGRPFHRRTHRKKSKRSRRHSGLTTVCRMKSPGGWSN